MRKVSSKRRSSLIQDDVFIVGIMKLLFLSSWGFCYGWVPMINPCSISQGSLQKRWQVLLFANPVKHGARKQSRTSTILAPEKGELYVDEEAPAGITGAEFFGGNKQKEEFFDPIAEAEASELSGVVIAETTKPTSIAEATETTVDKSIHLVDRFMIDGAFDTTTTSAIAHDLQEQINSILYEDEREQQQRQKQQSRGNTAPYKYSNNLQWDSPFRKSTEDNPLSELAKCLDFYRRVDLAITSGKFLESNIRESIYNLCFEVAVTWPTLWEPRILLTGTSQITINCITKEIVKQIDILDEGSDNLTMSIIRQLIPRFWDLYHIGMAPSSELSPEIRNNNKKRALFASYKLYSVPPRLYLRPSLLESSNRENREKNNAAFIPNHAFSCVIKTMGPLKQRYSATSPVTVQITPKQQDSSSFFELSWEIPLSVEYVSHSSLQLPPRDYDSLNDPRNQHCQFVWKPRRILATLPYYGGSSPQDEAVVGVRKKLYELVTKDGFQPRLDSLGRPQFFFIQKNIKACFTEEGFGMAIYEWRPRLSQPNEIGIDLIDTENEPSRQLSKT